MSHIELITSIRAELGNGNHLDAWELALESRDVVALAYVEQHAPITMTPDHRRGDGIEVRRMINAVVKRGHFSADRDTVIKIGATWVAYWRTAGSFASVASLHWTAGREPTHFGTRVIRHRADQRTQPPSTT